MFQKFNQILQKNNLLIPDKHVLLAVSGGVDSIVLFHLMKNIPQENRPQLSVAHINHQLRTEADEEEHFVKQLAQKDDLPFYSFRWDKDKHPETGIEESARTIRYSFFKELMNKYQMDILMTAHHQDDQVETILMKLTRGSTLAQLTGIQFSQSFAEGELVRPLLGFSKEELYTFAEEQKFTYFEDASNYELTHTRNRFRNQIIPLLKNENEQFNHHIEQFSLELSDLLEVSKDVIDEIFNQVVKKTMDGMELLIPKYIHSSKAEQRVVLKHLLDSLYQSEGYQYKKNYIALIHDWILNGEVNTQLDLQNDIVAKKEYNIISFSKRSAQKKFTGRSSFLMNEVNQWIDLSENEKIGLFLLDDNEDVSDYMQDENALVINEERLRLPLTVRHRRAGDRMRYAGLNGSKKIKDIFIDEKTPVKMRDQAWVIEDNAGDILWLISYRKMQLFTAQEADKLTYILKYMKD